MEQQHNKHTYLDKLELELAEETREDGAGLELGHALAQAQARVEVKGRKFLLVDLGKLAVLGEPTLGQEVLRLQWKKKKRGEQVGKEKTNGRE